MINMIVAFPTVETGKGIKNILVRSGYHVPAVCTSGAQTLTEAHSMQYGVVIASYRLPDMMVSQLRENLPEGFRVVTIASAAQWELVRSDGIVCLNPPVKVHELLSTVEMVCVEIERTRRRRKNTPPKRSPEELERIAQAKGLLMERNNMTEEEAHRYMQKVSMDAGRSILETADMLLSMLE